MAVTSSTQSLALYPPSLVPTVPTNGIFWDRMPVVADTPTLIGDCLRWAKLGREPLLPHLSRSPAVINLFATESVRLDVEDHLLEAAEEVRQPAELVEQIWRERVSPTVSFVNLDALPPRDPRVARLAAEDPDDAPTGSLAELLGPCLVFSTDPHLVESGIARKDWGNLMTHTREVGLYQAGTSGTVLVTVIVVGGGVELGAALMAAARRYPVPALILGGIGTYLIYCYWQSERGVGHRTEARALLADGGKRLTSFLLRATECQELLEAAAFVPQGKATQLGAVARVIAAAPRPLRAAEVAERLDITTQKAAATLRHPIFTRTPNAQYLLGRPGRAPSGELPPEAIG